MMRDEVTVRYAGGSVRVFIEKADRAHCDTGFNEESKLGLLREAEKGNPSLLKIRDL